ncbi:MAG: hypothetical protein IBX56_18085, partial [Methylomicrobium sp.]|nr:hypothetical protein [Methylomicrobium sp.]
MSIVKKIPWKKWSPPSDFPCQMPSIEDEKRPSQAICLDSLWTIHHPWPDRFFGPERGEILCRDPVGMCLGAAENFYGPFWHSEPKYASDVNSFFNSYVNFKHNVSGAELLKLYRIGFFFDFDFDHHLAGISHLNSREDVKQIINYAVGRPVNSPVHIDDRYMRCRNFHHHPKIPVSILENPIAFIVRVLNIVGATTEIS